MPDEFDTSLDDSTEGLRGAALRTAQLAEAMRNARAPGPGLAINPPPDYSPPVGAGVMYATNGPANFSQATIGPGGQPLPSNAVNARFVQGPPPEDPETQMMRKFLNTIPVDQAERAIRVAQQFQAKRAYQKRSASGVDPAQNLMQYFVESGATGGGMKSSDLSNIARAQEAFARAQPFTPRAVNVGGNQLVETGRGRFAFPPKVSPPVRWTTHTDSKTGRTIQTNPLTGESRVIEEGSAPADSTKAQKTIIDAERRRLTARLNNSQLFQREVDITKKEMGIDDDSQAKAFVEGDLNNRLKALDAQEANLGKAPVVALATPVAPAPVAASTATTTRKTLTRELAKAFLTKARGDKAKARQMAKDAGYDF